MGEVKPGAEGGTSMTAAGLTVAVGEADWEGGTGVGYATTEAAAAEDWSLHLFKEVEECSYESNPFPLLRYLQPLTVTYFGFIAT